MNLSILYLRESYGHVFPLWSRSEEEEQTPSNASHRVPLNLTCESNKFLPMNLKRAKNVPGMGSGASSALLSVDATGNGDAGGSQRLM